MFSTVRFSLEGFLNYLKRNLLIYQLVLLAAGIAVNWLLQYRNIEGNSFLPNRLTGIGVADRPWMPDGSTPQPIFFQHYFGDWLIRFSYANLDNPYDQRLLFPEVFPPFGILFFRLLGFIPPIISYVIFNIITFLVWIKVLSIYFSKKSILEKILFLFVFVVFTLPAIFNFDRGSVFVFIYGTVALILYWDSQNTKKMWVIILFTIVVSLKPYLLILILWWVRRKKIKLASLMLLVPILCNVLSCWFFSIQLAVLKDYYQTALFFKGGLFQYGILDQLNLIAWIARVYALFHDHKSTGEFLIQISLYKDAISIVIGLVLIIVVTSKHVPNKLALVILLASTPMFITSMQYTLSVFSLIVLVLISNSLYEVNSDVLSRKPSIPYQLSEIGILLTSLGVLTPFFINLHDRSGLSSPVLDPSGSYQYSSHLLNSYIYPPMFVFVLLTLLIGLVQLNLSSRNYQKVISAVRTTKFERSI
jgi:hypothetical protein